MLFKTSAALLWIVVFCLSAGGVSAQDDPVRVIPVTGMLPRVRLSPDGQTLAVFEEMNAHDYDVDPLYLPLRLIDVVTGTERQLIGHIDYAMDAIFTLDSKQLISYHGNGVIILWDVASGEIVKEIPAVPGSTRLLLLPDGKTLAALMTQVIGQIWLWDIETGFITAILADRSSTYSDLLENSNANLYRRFLTFAASPDGTQIATVTLTGAISVWNSATGEMRLLRQGDEWPSFNIMSIQFMPDGKSLMYYNLDDQAVHFWDVASASEIQTIAVAEKAHVAISTDGSRIAWVSPEENTVVVADVTQPDNQTVIDLPPTDLTYAPFVMQTLFFAGDQIVFSSFLATDGENQIYVITLPS